MPAISIVTIVYNGLPFLKQCVESVLAQDFTDWELLISDDGSSDGSREYLDTLNDGRISIHKQQKNLGIFDNLNFLFAKAKSPLTQILCQDDYFCDGTSLSRIIDYWKKAPSDQGIVRFNHATLPDKQLLGYQKKILPSDIPAGNADIWFYIFGNIMGNLSNVSLRTDIVAQCGWFSQSLPYAGDFEFWSRAARTVGAGIEDQVVVKIRRHPEVASNSLNKRGELFSQKKIVVTLLYNRLLAKHPKASFALRLHGTLQYDCLARDAAIKARLKGNKVFYAAFKESSRRTAYAFGSMAKRLFYFMSVGGRRGRVLSTKYLLGRLEKDRGTTS